MENNTKKRMNQFLSENSSIIAVLLLMVLGTAAYGTTFLNYKKNLINVLHTASMMGIMGIGVNICFLIGARDLSVGALAALVSMVTAWLSPWGFVPALVGGLVVGALFGALNGAVVGFFKVQPFIATLGTQLAARGLALLINKELSISLGTNAPQLKYIGNGNVLGILPFPAFVFIILILGMTVLLKFHDFGRGVYAVGGDENAAEMMGIHVNRTKIIVFTISGLMAAVSGIILCGRLSAGQPTACEGWEMTIMAAVVIGGTSVRGGLGKIHGIFFGCLFVNFITNLINLNGHISAYWKDIITGIVLLIAVLAQVYSDRQKEKSKKSEKEVKA